MSAEWLTLNALKSGRSGHLPADSPLDRQASKGLVGARGLEPPTPNSMSPSIACGKRSEEQNGGLARQRDAAYRDAQVRIPRGTGGGSTCRCGGGMGETPAVSRSNRKMARAPPCCGRPAEG